MENGIVVKKIQGFTSMPLLQITNDFLRELGEHYGNMDSSRYTYLLV